MKYDLNIKDLKAVVFDWDNTLAESRTALVFAVNKVLAEYGLKNWEIEKKKYIENLKNNIKYSYIEEKGKEAQIEFEINEVFDASKIEIV